MLPSNCPLRETIAPILTPSKTSSEAMLTVSLGATNDRVYLTKIIPFKILHHGVTRQNQIAIAIGYKAVHNPSMCWTKLLRYSPENIPFVPTVPSQVSGTTPRTSSQISTYPKLRPVASRDCRQIFIRWVLLASRVSRCALPPCSLVPRRNEGSITPRRVVVRVWDPVTVHSEPSRYIGAAPEAME